jgi:hypothetical protein
LAEQGAIEPERPKNLSSSARGSKPGILPHRDAGWYDSGVRKHRVRRKHDQDYWEPFGAYLTAARKAQKVAFKVPAEVWVGMPFWALMGAYLFRLGSSRTAWDKNWWKVVLLVVAGELLLYVIRPICRFAVALWGVCHEDRFKGISRDNFKVAVTMFVFVASWGVGFWYDSYIRSPHFKLAIDGKWAIANVTDYSGASASHPTAAVFFSKMILVNKYAPAFPHNWRLVLGFPDGDEIDGVPSPRGAV